MENKEEISYEKYLDVFGFPIKEYYKKQGLNLSIKHLKKWAIILLENINH